MTKLLKNQESKGQWIWVLLVRLIGIIMLIAPLYLPLRAYFFTSIENIDLTRNDIIIACVGLFVSAGGKTIGTLVNNIGLVINKFLNKI